MPTPVRIVERKARRLILESRPDWGVWCCGLGFLAAAVGLLGWAFANGLATMAFLDSCTLLLLDFVLFYLGLYGLLLPLGTEQTLTLDKAMGTLEVRTKGLFGPQIDRYRLRDVLKVHHNRVDDGTFDKNALLFIFRGGGAIQFPSGSGNAESVRVLVNIVTNFLGVDRSDTAQKQLASRLRRQTGRLTVQWEPELQRSFNKR